MPYINNEQRKKYSKVIKTIDKLTDIETKGDLEYLVYYLMKKYMKKRLFRYSILHDVVYAVIHAGEEFKRRNLDVRENEALKNNGDI